MHQYIPLLMSMVLVPASVLMDTSDMISHQHLTVGDIQATVHLQPDDSPFVGQPSPTWIHLLRSDGETVPLTDCDCNLVVYDSQDRAIAHPTLAETPVAGHEQPMGTSITFPAPGNYRLMFAGQSKSESFKPFELEIPVTVRP